ncbi:hypothetical protein COV23_01115 [Candidatus Wolfebacteria bacterium CG10_big_fil_rev_8_21_14_0_10_31_9]|uniref:L,D-TPase catalytic domain-containing protein n=1 Tax=Candidatus Wolfebacteria bacterium CG10_big_fil_rev_8_21_14_0_10_31_9 TaxID=1975070 RepID=A0A2H0RCK3_9BACT|nr:MAG: hypothetical protein COV23_01115 [Candidatus Wolfebacteria bacterium CG10_big_fil_rev_8_21_14_0_10_31_9]
MNTMRRIAGVFNKEIQVWVILVVFFIITAGVSMFIRYYPHTSEMADQLFGFETNIESPLVYGPRASLSNIDVFEKTRDEFLLKKNDFIEVNLSAMTLYVYKGGEKVLSIPVKSKGREGSWWETPAGIYKAGQKEKNHFSSLGKVYQPWSIPFQGNFFIHGWPYYSDGTPVSKQYSGGCIRLETEDAEKVYEFVEFGMPILVYETQDTGNTFLYSDKPEITAISALAVDIQNNSVLYEKNSKEILPIASITKLMTAIISTEFMNIEKNITINNSMIATTSIPRLVENQQYSVYDLLFVLLQESSNEAAYALSYPLGSIRFISLLNDRALSIGMTNTHFADSAGVLSADESTAEDLFLLTKYLFNNRKFILSISAGKASTVNYGEPKFKGIKNLNIFSNDPEFVGGKIGLSSSAKNTGLFIFNTPISGEYRNIAIIVLNSDNLKQDVNTIREYIKRTYLKKGVDGVSAASSDDLII